MTLKRLSKIGLEKACAQLSERATIDVKTDLKTKNL